MRIKPTLYLASLLWLAPIAAYAQDAAAQLRHFIENVSAASGEFHQKSADRAPQEGRFAFQRPGKFRWETTHPHEQLIVSDGTTVRQYDPDLAQVTERPANTSLGSSPAAILFGSGRLEDAFTLAALPDDDGLQWLRATPRQADAGFQYLDIGLRKQQPVRLLLRDAFDKTTYIELGGMTLNPSLDDSQFTLQVPADADIVQLR
ncbi:outer membrane lipoprotein chaperone LolA [Pusillimonas sp. CC-YST705]|uniref:Outer-membrane lipoprotein carrier protein n=1 Tax=Mesopusillimonas faecipullorum TaxID=2755040 RepID=A0ABS8C968_9BURK|nr:outer membrane lipoprotein chaperone LolA [Mesopusillimonas faecipullorum]MCB5362577.1 outer membrane lipoprotein chaperone LolA [Mesopusillimonas faecipullorum]